MDKVTDNNFYVGWGTLMLINANLAHLKGRSRSNWLAASLFLGPIATLILLFTELPKPPAPPVA
jgi:hypothetical protein